MVPERNCRSGIKKLEANTAFLLVIIRKLSSNFSPLKSLNGSLSFDPDAQLELLELEPGVSSAEVEAESQRGQLTLPLRTVRKHPGRQELPADLPRIEQIIACRPEQCICGNCGKETTVIGYEQSEQLDVQPTKYFVRVTKREKRACKRCEDQGVQCAPLPSRIIEKGLASDRVVIDTVVSKYADHLPLYRQSERPVWSSPERPSMVGSRGWVNYSDPSV